MILFSFQCCVLLKIRSEEMDNTNLLLNQSRWDLKSHLWPNNAAATWAPLHPSDPIKYARWRLPYIRDILASLFVQCEEAETMWSIFTYGLWSTSDVPLSKTCSCHLSRGSNVFSKILKKKLRMAKWFGNFFSSSTIVHYTSKASCLNQRHIQSKRPT